jgi:hypothetical protein
LTASVGSVGGPPAAIAQYVYTLSPAGQRLTTAETVVRAALPQSINRLFSYDATYRIVGEAISGAPNSASRAPPAASRPARWTTKASR